MWSGSIAFGLVNIPVKMYSAVQPRDVHFHQLHDADGVRIQQKRVCPADEQEVPYEHIVKGYEISKGRYVIVRPEELRALDPKGTDTIDIQQFVDPSQIDPVQFESSYYLGPDRGAAKAYALLVAAMHKAGKAGLGRVVLRTRQYLVLLRPLEGVLALETLLYADEVVSPQVVEVPKSDAIDERELAMAIQLIGALGGDFEPERWRDEYRERVLALIERKAGGAEIVQQPELERAAPVLDLVSALRASLEQARAPGARPRRAEPAARTEGEGAPRAKATGGRARRPRKSA